MKFEDEATSDLWSSAGGKVPDGWSVVRFESFLAGPKAIAVGVMYPGDHVSDGVPCIRVGDVQPGGTVGIPTMNISCEVHSQYVRTEISGDELLITLVGNPGQCVIATPEMAGWNAARALAVARLESPDLRPYLKAVLESAPMKSIVLSMLNTTVQPTLNLKEIRALPVPIPPNWSEAKAIGSFSELIESKIANNRALAADLEAMARAIFKSWFVDFDPVKAKMEGRAPAGMDAETAALFPDELVESELGLIPKGWEVKPLLDVCDLLGGAQPPAKTFVSEPQDGYVRLLQIRDFTNDNHPTYVPESKKLRRVEADDILIGRYGSASGDKKKDSLGRICRGKAGVYNVALMKLDPKLVGREFALRLLDADAFYQYLQGISMKAVQSGFSKKELAQYLVVVPTRSAAAAYERIGEAIWNRIKNLNGESESWTALRDTLLPRLISGKLSITESEAATSE